VIGILVNPTFTDAEAEARDAMQAATLLGVQTEIVRAHGVDQFSTAFATLAQKKVGGFVMANDAFFFRERHQLLALAARYDMPAIYCWREFALEGGLMSYAPSLTQGYRQVGVYVGRILKGEKPGDLPVQQPTKFEFVINLQTAKKLGLIFPPGLLAIADEVIE
jgi:putative ABC transport system substrate-binding protein